MIVAVTGGSGFIGKKLVAHLVERGDTVRMLTRNPNAAEKSHLLEMYRCDLLTAGVEYLSHMLDGVDVLYHCAGQLKDALAMRALHVDATRKLAEAASGRIARWVQLSSVGVYGPVAKGAVTEDSELNPAGEYEVTKAESERIVMDAADNGGFSYAVLRPSNVFGAGMSNQSLYRLIAMIDRGLFFYIGKQGASANYIHVDNVVEGLVRCGVMQQAKGGIYDLSDHRTIEYFVGVIADALGSASPWLRIPEQIAYLSANILGRMPGFPLTPSRVDALVNRSIYPISRIQRELGYGHVTSMEDGLRELVEFYKLKQTS